MMTKIKTDLPSERDQRFAAEKIQRMKNRYNANGKTPVYLIGYGAKRDWDSGVSAIFSEYLDGLIPVWVPQVDKPNPGGYRHLMKNPTKLNVKGSSFGIVYDSSSRGFIPNDGTFAFPASPSQCGSLIDILISTDVPHITTCSTEDYVGATAIPIEYLYVAKKRHYTGPRRLLVLNSIKPAAAIYAELNHVKTEDIEKDIAEGKIIPSRLIRYEKYLRHRNFYTDRRPLEDVLFKHLDRICEDLVDGPIVPVKEISATLAPLKESSGLVMAND